MPIRCATSTEWRSTFWGEARAELQPPDAPQDIRRHALHLRLVSRRLARLVNGLFHALGHALDDFLDTRRMDASVRHKLFERLPRDLAAHGIESGNHHRLGRVVDQHVHAGHRLKRADVSSLASDDAPFDVVARQRHRASHHLARVSNGKALHGHRHDACGLALTGFLGFLLNAANEAPRLAPHFLLGPVVHFAPRLFVRHTGQLLQPVFRLLPTLVRLRAPQLQFLRLVLLLLLLLENGLLLFLKKDRLLVHVLFPDCQAFFDVLKLLAPRLGAFLELLASLHHFGASLYIGLFQPVLDFDIRSIEFESGLFFNRIGLPPTDQPAQRITAQHARQPEQQADCGVAHIVPCEIRHKNIPNAFPPYCLFTSASHPQTGHRSNLLLSYLFRRTDSIFLVFDSKLCCRFPVPRFKLRFPNSIAFPHPLLYHSPP